MPFPKAMRLPGARVAVDKGWVKFRNLPARQESEVRIKKEVIGLAETDGKAVHFFNVYGLMPPARLWFGQEVHEVQRAFRTSWWCSKRWVRILCSIHRPNFACTEDDCHQTLICYFATARPRRRSQRCCFQHTQWKIEKVTNLKRLAEAECPAIWAPTRATICKPKMMVQHDRSCGAIGKAFARTSCKSFFFFRKKKSEHTLAEVLLEDGWERVPGWESKKWLLVDVDAFFQWRARGISWCAKSTLKNQLELPTKFSWDVRSAKSETNKILVM